MYLTQDFQDGDWKAKATLKPDEEIGVILKELSKAAPCKEKEEDLSGFKMDSFQHSNPKGEGSRFRRSNPHWIELEFDRDGVLSTSSQARRGPLQGVYLELISTWFSTKWIFNRWTKRKSDSNMFSPKGGEGSRLRLRDRQGDDAEVPSINTGVEVRVSSPNACLAAGGGLR
jgi:hypothetical protein